MTKTTGYAYVKVPTVETKLVVRTCGQCGVVLGMGEEFYKARRKDGQTWYCPNGHPRVFTGPSEEDKLRQQLEWERSRSESWKDQAEAAERAKTALKGQNTRLKKRISNGVCPCCHRTFQNLQRHMAGQHPDFTGDP